MGANEDWGGAIYLPWGLLKHDRRSESLAIEDGVCAERIVCNTGEKIQLDFY